MKKLNNKGFAISTLLYSLVLMMFFVVLALMGILGTTRNNSSDLSAATKNQLMEYGSKKTDVAIKHNDDYGEIYLYKVKESGWYSTLLVGPAFGGKRGSAATGIIYLKKGEFLTIILPNNETDIDDPEPASIIFNEDEDHPEYTIMSTMGYSNTSNNFHGREYTINGYAGSIVSDKLKELDRNPVFYNGFIIPDVNEGAGYFRINKISNNEINDNPLKQYRPELNNVRYIRDCVRGNTVNKWGHWTEIQAIDQNGDNVALNKPVTYPSNNTESDSTRTSELVTDGDIYDQESGGYYDLTAANNDTDKCVTVDLGANYNLNEIAIWHYYADNRIYKGNHVEVGATTDSMSEIGRFSTADSCGVRDSSLERYYFDVCANRKYRNHDSILGNRISRFQPKLDNNSEQVGGHYYIYTEEYENSSNYRPFYSNVRLLYASKSDYTFEGEVHILNNPYYNSNNVDFSKFEPTARWIIEDGRSTSNNEYTPKRISIYTDKDPVNGVEDKQLKMEVTDACPSAHCSGTSYGLVLAESYYWSSDSEVLVGLIEPKSKYYYLKGNMMLNPNKYPNLFFHQFHSGYSSGTYLNSDKKVDTILNTAESFDLKYRDQADFNSKTKNVGFTFSFYKLY